MTVGEWLATLATLPPVRVELANRDLTFSLPIDVADTLDRRTLARPVIAIALVVGDEPAPSTVGWAPGELTEAYGR